MIKINEILGRECFPKSEKDYVVPHAYPVMLKSREKRDEYLRALPEKFGIESRQVFSSIPTQNQAYEFLGEKQGNYPIAEDIGNRGLYVPCHQNLKEEEIIKVSEVLKEIIKNE